MREDALMMLLVMGVVVVVITSIMVCAVITLDYVTQTDRDVQFFVAWLFGARFDLAFKSLKEGNFRPPNRIRHDEL